MRKIAIYSPHRTKIDGWHPWLSQHYEVTYVSSDEALLALLTTWRPNLLIYHDKLVRSEFHLTLFRRLTQENIRSIVVTPIYDLREEILAFELGADHFLLAVTPIESLKARVESLLRKMTPSAKTRDTGISAPLPHNFLPLRYQSLQIFPDQNLVKSEHASVRLTPTQLQILTALVSHAGQLVTRDWLQAHVFRGQSISLRSIDAHIAKLKKAVPLLKTEIISIYGKGYILKGAAKSAA